MTERVSTAVHMVDWAYLCLDDQGSQLPQTSAPEVITRMLQLLDVWPGYHVLELGTGSGYSTALLAELVGPHGSIVSIDVDPQMTPTGHAAAGRRGVQVPQDPGRFHHRRRACARWIHSTYAHAVSAMGS
jgi:protein-L-isoaspartate(D-aspartate) O-methyltransferase